MRLIHFLDENNNNFEEFIKELKVDCKKAINELKKIFDNHRLLG